MKNIRVAFERDKGFFAWLIRKISGYPYNHIFLVYESEEWVGDWAFEAAAAGVRTVPRKERKWLNVYSLTYDGAPAMRRVQTLIGEKYDFRSLFIFGVFILFWRWFRVKIRRPGSKSKTQFCSELVARVFIEAQECHKTEISDPQWAKPQDIEEIMKKHPDLYKSPA